MTSARHQLSRWRADTMVSGNVLGAPDSFAITVSDGQGGTMTTPLTF
ncbi:MAG TPA: hypothetical protein VN888_01315 [Mycobacterium sp.]|nr:hypothetical protein [Mycobacterium sp.]